MSPHGSERSRRVRSSEGVATTVGFADSRRYLAWGLLLSTAWLTRCKPAPGRARVREIPRLTQILETQDWNEQADALDQLGQLAATEPRALSVLIHALRSSSWAVRHGATQALAQLGPMAAPAVPVLMETLEDTDWIVRLGAVQALDRIGSWVAIAAPALVRARADPSRVVQEAASNVLQHLAETIPSVRDTVRARRQGRFHHPDYR